MNSDTSQRRGINRTVSTEQHRDVATVPGDVRGHICESDPREDARTPAGRCAVIPRIVCPGCGNEIDPDCCGCGDSKEYHGSAYNVGHSFIPMGCDCFRVKSSDSGGENE